MVDASGKDTFVMGFPTNTMTVEMAQMNFDVTTTLAFNFTQNVLISNSASWLIGFCFPQTSFLKIKRVSGSFTVKMAHKTHSDNSIFFLGTKGCYFFHF